ncbi:MAG: hypothetical protein WEA04_01880 [Candidatus Andersenbacteria bacterium]
MSRICCFQCGDLLYASAQGHWPPDGDIPLIGQRLIFCCSCCTKESTDEATQEGTVPSAVLATSSTPSCSLPLVGSAPHAAHPSLLTLQQARYFWLRPPLDK